MVKLEIDQEKKLVEVEITGFIKNDEAVRLSNELKKALAKYGPQEACLLIDLTGFMPMEKDVLSVLRGMGRDVIGYFHKAALVQEFASLNPSRKVIEPPPGVKLPSFTSREEAVRYLFDS
jgi:hypothetical protein